MSKARRVRICNELDRSVRVFAIVSANKLKKNDYFNIYESSFYESICAT